MALVYSEKILLSRIIFNFPFKKILEGWCLGRVVFGSLFLIFAVLLRFFPNCLRLFAVVCALLRLFAFLKFFKVVHVGEPARAAYNQVV